MTELSRGRRRRTRRERRPGLRMPWGLIHTALLVAGLLWAARYAEDLEERAYDEGIGWVDPLVLAGIQLPEWCDARWQAEYEGSLEGLEPFRVDDAHALDEVYDAIAALSFVDSVDCLRTIWPDEIELEFSLRRPVACVTVALGNGDRATLDWRDRPLVYRTVAADGTLLSGVWRRPPRTATGWLPVLGSPRDGSMIELLSLAQPGDWLAEPEHLAALDVAVSLDECLDGPERERLGRIVIDARDADIASALEPGIRLDLENRRRILFGGAPSMATAGELAVTRKWRSIAKGLHALDDPWTEWDVLDARWDVPEVLLRHPRVVGTPATNGRAL